MCKRIEIVGVGFDPLRRDEAVGQIQSWIAAGRGRCRLVLLPGIEDIVLLKRHAGWKVAYEQADLVLAASWPIAWAARWLGRPRVTSLTPQALTAALFDAASQERPLAVFVLGSRQQEPASFEERWPDVRVVGSYCPPPDFEHDHAESLRILARIADAKPDLVLVTAPAAERALWLHRYKAQLQARVALCTGAADWNEIAFSPPWLRTAGLEWLRQLPGQPERQAARYGRAAWSFGQIVFHEWWQKARVQPLVKSWGP